MAHASGTFTDHVIESLLFPDVQRSHSSQCDVESGATATDRRTPCILCKQEFLLAEDSSEFYKHLLQAHQLVIKEVHLISDFNKYLECWRKKFSQADYKLVCNKYEKDSTVQYSLDPSIPEDHEIRESLQRRRLDAVLAVQQGERDDTSLSRSCLFCRESFTGNRAALLNHMAFSHSFNVGQPDNIVFANEFLDLMERTLESLQCLYCEKIFRDRTALKDHMRKKQHRKLNPNNKAYDRFYIINYLEPGKDWQQVQAERDVTTGSPDSAIEETWDDWEDDLQTSLVCLFCKHSSALVTGLLSHMLQTHCFDFYRLKTELDLSFYDQVKLVNFIRRCVHQSVCVYCPHKFETSQELMEHLPSHSSHMESGLERTRWDQSQYLFPTYENDALLCSLEDFSDDNDREETSPPGKHSLSSVPILAEDRPVTEESILFREQDVLQALKTGR